MTLSKLRSEVTTALRGGNEDGEITPKIWVVGHNALAPKLDYNECKTEVKPDLQDQEQNQGLLLLSSNLSVKFYLP